MERLQALKALIPTLFGVLFEGTLDHAQTTMLSAGKGWLKH